MIGDLILIVTRFLYQHFFCIHKYKRYHAGPEYCWIECEKCHKITDNYDLINN
jgi:hypothetical protein